MSISGISSAYMQPQIMSGASTPMPPAQKMTNLFQQIDTGNTGSITQAQFDQAFQSMSPPGAAKSMGADTIFSTLDPTGSGSVSQQDFVNGMQSLMRQGYQSGVNNAAPPPAQTLSASLDLLNAKGTLSSSRASGSNINVTA